MTTQQSQGPSMADFMAMLQNMELKIDNQLGSFKANLDAMHNQVVALTADPNSAANTTSNMNPQPSQYESRHPIARESIFAPAIPTPLSFSTTSSAKIPIFDGKGDFTTWRNRLELLLQKDGLWYTVLQDDPLWENRIPTPHGRNQEADRASALFQIIQHLADTEARQILGKTKSPYSALDILKKRHESSSVSHMYSLLEKTFGLSQTKYKNLTEYLDAAKKLKTEWEGGNFELTYDSLLAFALLRGLKEDLNPLRIVIEHHGTAGLDNVINKLEAEAEKEKHNVEIKRSETQSSTTKSDAYYSSSNQKGKSSKFCTYCNTAGHEEKYCYSRKRNEEGRSSDKDKRQSRGRDKSPKRDADRNRSRSRSRSRSKSPDHRRHWKGKKDKSDRRDNHYASLAIAGSTNTDSAATARHWSKWKLS